MSHISAKDAEDYNICPYDPLHRIQEKQWRVHLQKCSKEYPNVRVKECPFNSAHVMRDDGHTYDRHLRYCRDRLQAYALQKASDSIANGHYNPLPPEPDYGHDIGENWEDDMPTEAIVGVPPEALSGRGYLKDLAGMKRKDKKKFRERLQMENAGIIINDNNNTDDSEMAPLDDPSSDDDFSLEQQFKGKGRGRGVGLREDDRSKLSYLPVGLSRGDDRQPQRPGQTIHIPMGKGGSIPGAGRGIRR